MDDAGDWTLEAVGLPQLPEIEPRDVRSTKIVVFGLPANIQEKGLRILCKKFGKVVETWFAHDKNMAFVTYEHIYEAERAVGGLVKYSGFPISVEFAKEKEDPFSIGKDEFDKIVYTIENYRDDVFENVFDPTQRQVHGPFSPPADVLQLKKSIMYDEDYDNHHLLSADPSKDFLWHYMDEAVVELESEIHNKKIVHGRAVYKDFEQNDASNKVTSKEAIIFTGDALLNIPSESCAKLLCKLFADKHCKTCKNWYCSIECSNDDKNHSCLHGMAHSNGTANFEDKKPIVQTHPLHKYVKITCVVNHQLIFVRPAAAADDISFARLVNDVISQSKQANKLKKLPPIGSYVLASFGEFYQRALVLKHISDVEVAVAFIDYGNVETIKFSELKEMPNELKQISRFATRIWLRDVNEGLMNDEAVRYLYKLMLTDNELYIDIDDENVQPVKAKLYCSGVDVNELVRTWNLFEMDRENDVFYSNEPFEIGQNRSCVGENIPVIVLNNSFIVGSQLVLLRVADINQFIRNDEKIQTMGKLIMPTFRCYLPPKGEYCLVNYPKDKRWYRAQCIETAYDGYVTLYFIDYGCMLPVQHNKVHRLPKPLHFDYITLDPICFPRLMNEKQPAEEAANLMKLLFEEYSVLSEKLLKELKLDDESNELVASF